MEESLGITSDEIEGRLSFPISNVSHFREAADEGEILKNRCMIYFKSGDSVLIGMSYDEFEKYFNQYYLEK